jgi:hypothetical protein
MNRFYPKPNSHDPLFWLKSSEFWAHHARLNIIWGRADEAAFCARCAVRTLGQALYPCDGVYEPPPRPKAEPTLPCETCGGLPCLEGCAP